MAFAFIASIVVGDRLFPLLSANNDEAVYRFQAEVFRSGQLTLEAEPFRDFFKPWMTAEHDGRLIGVFQPIFPAVLALSDRLFGTMRIALALIAAASVLLVAALGKELGRSPRERAIAATLFALSPFVVVQSALYLEYLFAVMLLLGALTLALRAAQRDAPPQWLRAGTGCGALLGLLLIARPLEALLASAAIAVFVLHSSAKLHGRSYLKAGAARLVPIALGGLPFTLAMLAYNAHLTGNPLRFPLWAIGGNNAFGFGRRNIVDGSPLIDMTPLNALKAMHQNLRALPHWMFGSVALVPFGVYGAYVHRREAATRLLLAIAVLFPLGYFFYWGNLLIVNGRKQIGPHYYLALMIPAVLFAASGVEAVLKRSPRPRATATILVAVFVAATAIELPDKIDRNQHFTDAYRQEQRALEAVAPTSIVILPITPDGPFLLHPRGFLTNSLDLDDDVLFAADRGGENITLAARFPDRKLYRLQAVEATRSPLTFKPSVTERKVENFRQVNETFRAEGAARAYIAVGGDRKDCSIARGGLDVDLRSAGSLGCSGDDSALSLPAGFHTVTIGFEFVDGSGRLQQTIERRRWVSIGAAGVTMEPEWWRIVPADKTPARVIESSDDVQLIESRTVAS